MQMNQLLLGAFLRKQNKYSINVSTDMTITVEHNTFLIYFISSVAMKIATPKILQKCSLIFEL